MATRSKMLCDRLHDLASEARREEAYSRMLALTTAEDLSDGMLKGDESAERVDHLLSAYSHNFDSAEGPEDQVAWGDAMAAAREVFGLPVGYLPAGA